MQYQNIGLWSDEWYLIPGYNGYKVNRQGMVISFKHFRSEPFHVMQEDKKGYYTLSNDIKGSVKITRKQVIDLVFNSDEKPQLALNGIYMGGMQQLAKKQKHPIGMDFSKFMK